MSKHLAFPSAVRVARRFQAQQNRTAAPTLEAFENLMQRLYDSGSSVRAKDPTRPGSTDDRVRSGTLTTGRLKDSSRNPSSSLLYTQG